MKINILDIERKLNSESSVENLLAYYIILAKYKNIVNMPRIHELMAQLLIEIDEDAEEYSSALFAYLGINHTDIGYFSRVDVFNMMDLQDIVMGAAYDLSGEEVCKELLNTCAARVFNNFSEYSLEYNVVALKLACHYQILYDERGFNDAVMRLNDEYLIRYHNLHPYYFANAYCLLGNSVAGPRSIELNTWALELLPMVIDGDYKDNLITTFNLAHSYYIHGYEQNGNYVVEQLLDYQKEYIAECPYIFFMAYILKLETTFLVQKHSMDEIGAFFQSAENCLEYMEDELERDNCLGKLLMTKSKIYCDTSDFKECERYSRQAYELFKKIGNEQDRLLATTNLIIALYSQGMTIECGNYLSEAMRLIEENDAHGTPVADYVYNIWAIYASDKIEPKVDETIKSWVFNCQTVNMSNFFFIFTGLQKLILDKMDAKTQAQVERVLGLMEEYALKSQNYMMHCNFLACKATYLYKFNEKSQAAMYLLQLLHTEEISSPTCEITYELAVKKHEMFRQCLTPERLKYVLFKLVRMTPYRLQLLLEISDETALLRKLSYYGELYKTIISYACAGVIACSDREILEVVINSKNIYSELLYARKLIEKNNISEIDEYKRIHELHHTIIDMEVGGYFGHKQNQQEIDDLKAKRHSMEVNLLEKVNKDVFTWVSYEEIVSRIPDNVIYIDYLQYPGVVRDCNYLMDLQYLTMVLVKENGQVYLRRLPSVSLLSVRRVFVNMEDLVRRRSRKKDKSFLDLLLGDERRVFSKLYSLIMKPALDSLRNVSLQTIVPQTLLISGDAELSSFPFDLLMDENGNYLLDRYKISYVNSLKEYCGELYLSPEECRDGLVIGNPQFSIDKALDLESNSPHYLQPIPLSKVEAQAVGEALEVQPYTKKPANKYIFENINQRIIHIATHGNHYELEVESDGEGIFADYVYPLKNSCLFLSGANDFIMTEAKQDIYGTGIVTAEELYTYDFSSVKLMVMSACFSGSGDISYSQGLLGMVTSVMSQGIQNLITNLWEVDDFASAVFMTRFYSSIQHMSVADALYDAKHYLKNVTIRELSDFGWFGESRIRRIGLVAEDMRRISVMPEETRIFAKPFYWAGFVLMQR